MREDVMMRLVVEEDVNGITIGWAGNVPDKIRPSLSSWIERYPDLLPRGCSRIWVNMDLLQYTKGRLLRPMPTEQQPQEWILFVGERWYQEDPSTREKLFVTEMLCHRLLAEDRMPLVPEDPVIRLIADDSTLHQGEAAVKFISALE